MGFLKGQSLTEQMITYGWAMMILIVVIGVLVYFGVFNFSSSIPERCVFQNGFFCKGSRLYVESDGSLTVNFTITNKFSRPVNITGLLCSAESTNPAKGYPERGLVVPGAEIKILPEGSKSLALRCYKKDSGYRASTGESYEGLVYVKYTEEQAGFGGLTGEHMKIANIGGKVN